MNESLKKCGNMLQLYNHAFLRDTPHEESSFNHTETPKSF